MHVLDELSNSKVDNFLKNLIFRSHFERKPPLKNLGTCYIRKNDCLSLPISRLIGNNKIRYDYIPLEISLKPQSWKIDKSKSGPHYQTNALKCKYHFKDT